MACNALDPANGYNMDMRAASSAGIQILLRKPSGSGPPSPGNFSLVCPSAANCGGAAVQNLLASTGQAACTGTGIDTKTGIIAQKVNRGVNSRFDLPTVPNPAPNIGTYPQDANFTTVGNPYYGDADWDPVTYWAAEHVADGALPGGLQHYTRFQMYLYELDENFARDNGGCASNGGGADCRTIYPLTDDNGDAVTLPAGFAVVDPPALNLPDSGTPSTTPNPNPMDPRRRIFRVAVVDCVANTINGTEFISYEDIDIVDMFITEPAGDPSDFYIYLEIVRSREAEDSTDIINNAALIE